MYSCGYMHFKVSFQFICTVELIYSCRRLGVFRPVGFYLLSLFLVRYDILLRSLSYRKTTLVLFLQKSHCRKSTFHQKRLEAAILQNFIFFGWNFLLSAHRAQAPHSTQPPTSHSQPTHHHHTVCGLGNCLSLICRCADKEVVLTLLLDDACYDI